MEIMEPEIRMTALEEPVDEHLSDAEEQLRKSLIAVVQDGDVKPKLHCLMMDQSFSMVTVQSEDSGIMWETVSSRCSTPWASEVTTGLGDPTLVPCHPRAAGSITIIMDHHLTRRRKKQKQREAKPVSEEILAAAERPAMVQVSVPNVALAEEPQDATEEKHQRLFSLVSEGSEILNIIVPPKVSTVDEEESRGLEDNLYFLEVSPAAKPSEVLDEADVNVQSETVEERQPEVPLQPPPIPVTRIMATAEDYFEQFTLEDHQASSEAVEEQQDTVTECKNEVTEKKDKMVAETSGASELPRLSSAPSLLDISGEHLDDVFYGGDSNAQGLGIVGGRSEEGEETSKSTQKEAGTALFGTEESVLTPIYLPEGPEKIIDLNLLEEPKALAFLYSDLYAEAVGSRRKREDDVESMTSEKSFHSQQSDSEDRGYLEKFVLKVEALPADGDSSHKTKQEEPTQEPIRLTGYFEEPHRDEPETQEQEEITDFFRNSASSSPCEPLEPEPEPEPKAIRASRVSFKEEPSCVKTQPSEPTENPTSLTDDDTDSMDEFLPVELNKDCPAWEENLPLVSEVAVKHTSTVQSYQTSPADWRPEPISPKQKSFLELNPLLPVQPEEEETTTISTTTTTTTTSEQKPSEEPEITDPAPSTGDGES